MALQATTNIDVDFYDKKYILINAKQLDKNSRFLVVTCYNHGEPYGLYAGEHSAYIRYKKPDNHSVFNFCEINNKGKIIVELTEQMLVSDGICYADLVIVNKGDANVNPDTGEIVAIDNASVLSTMTFCIDVSEMVVLNSDIESSYEFDGLNIALERAEAEYGQVIKTSKSWAVGNTGIRDGENTDNSKYYAQQSSNSAGAANTSKLEAAESKRLAEEYMNDALTYSQNAQTYMNNAKISETNAKTSETNAYDSEVEAKGAQISAQISETNALNSETNAKISEANAGVSETNASISESNANQSEIVAATHALMTQSYFMGGTNSRDNEDKDNVVYYYGLIKNIINGIDTGFIPVGTISFSELLNAEKAVGYVYNIKDDFITDDTFAEGEGKSYTAGTNVYCRSDGLWDCFGGTTLPAATVDEVKIYLGIEVI